MRMRGNQTLVIAKRHPSFCSSLGSFHRRFRKKSTSICWFSSSTPMKSTMAKELVTWVGTSRPPGGTSVRRSGGRVQAMAPAAIPIIRKQVAIRRCIPSRILSESSRAARNDLMPIPLATISCPSVISGFRSTVPWQAPCGHTELGGMQGYCPLRAARYHLTTARRSSGSIYVTFAGGMAWLRPACR